MKILVAIAMIMSFGFMAAAEDLGQKTFAANCATCHGLDGKGQTDIGKSVKARNFVEATDKEFKNGADAKGIAKTIEKGVEGTAMVGFPQLKKEEKEALVKYILSLRPGAKKAEKAPAKKK